jgi:hypothetical protein
LLVDELTVTQLYTRVCIRIFFFLHQFFDFFTLFLRFLVQTREDANRLLKTDLRIQKPSRSLTGHDVAEQKILHSFRQSQSARFALNRIDVCLMKQSLCCDYDFEKTCVPKTLFFCPVLGQKLLDA